MTNKFTKRHCCGRETHTFDYEFKETCHFIHPSTPSFSNSLLQLNLGLKTKILETSDKTVIRGDDLHALDLARSFQRQLQHHAGGI